MPFYRQGNKIKIKPLAQGPLGVKWQRQVETDPAALAGFAVASLVPGLSSATGPPELFLCLRKASCSVNFKPLSSPHSLLKPFQTTDRLGKELNISLCLPTYFSLAQPVFPGEDGKKDGPWVGQSAEKPDSLENKFIIQTRNQSPKTTAPFIPPQIALWVVSGPSQTRGRDGGKQGHT